MKLPLAGLCTVLGLLAVSLAAPVFAQETTLNLITSYPKGAMLNEPMLRFVEEVNQRGKGVVRIRLVGGPEVTPVTEQIGSVQRGINHIYYGSMSYFQAQIDESRSLVISDYDVTELRRNGALDLLAKYFEAKPKLHYLAYFGSGYTFYIYLAKEPKRTADGVDLTGFRIRGPSIWQPVIVNLKATPVNVEVAEIFEALDRGTIDGAGWLDIGVTDFSWQKKLKHRITPNFWRGDVSFVVQLAAWDKLSKAAKDVLTEFARMSAPAVRSSILSVSSWTSCSSLCAGWLCADAWLAMSAAERLIAATAPCRRLAGRKTPCFPLFIRRVPFVNWSEVCNQWAAKRSRCRAAWMRAYAGAGPHAGEVAGSHCREARARCRAGSRRSRHCHCDQP